jgi:hypothetical protein
MFFFISIVAIIIATVFSFLSFFGLIATKNHNILLTIILLIFNYLAVILSTIFVFRLAFRQVVTNTLLFVFVSLFWIFAIHFSFHFLSQGLDEILNIQTIKGILKLPPFVFAIQVMGIYWFAKTKWIQGDLSRPNLTRADESVIMPDVSNYNEVSNQESHVTEYHS